MQHPLEFIPQNLRKSLFYVFLLLTFLIFGVFRGLDEPLRTNAAPNGVVSFELAWTPERADAIIFSWENSRWLDLPQSLDHEISPKLYAAFGLGLDYLFMPAYALALSLGLLLMMRGRPVWYLQLAAWMGWGMFAAALFDAVENFALWKELTGSVLSPYPEIAALCASVKFILLIAGLLAIIAGGFLKK
jgi:hypothetical protein